MKPHMDRVKRQQVQFSSPIGHISSHFNYQLTINTFFLHHVVDIQKPKKKKKGADVSNGQE